MSDKFEIEYKGTKIALYNADCSDVISGLGENTIHSVITSPPYFLNKEYESIRKDGKKTFSNWKEYSDWLCGIFLSLYSVVVPDGHLWINIDDAHTSLKMVGKNVSLPTHAAIIMSLSELFDYKDMVIWRHIRNSHAGGGANRLLGSYGRFRSPGAIPISGEIEFVLWFKKSGNRNVGDDVRKASALTPEEFRGFGLQVWELPPDFKNPHPAPFPVDIPWRCMKLSSFVGDTIFDPFAGSATTAIACMKGGRNFIGAELDKKYFEMACRRITDEAAKLSLF